MPHVNLVLTQKDGNATWLAWSIDPAAPLNIHAKFSTLDADTAWQPLANDALLRSGLAIFDPQQRQCYTLLLAHDGLYRIDFPDRSHSNQARVIQKLDADSNAWLDAKRTDLTQAEQFIFVRAAQWAPPSAVQQTVAQRYDSLHWLEFSQQDPGFTTHYAAEIEHRLNAGQIASLQAIVEFPLHALKIEAGTAKEYGLALCSIMTDTPVAEAETSPSTRDNIDTLQDYLSLEHIHSYHKDFYASINSNTRQGRDVTAADVHRFMMEVLRAEYVRYCPKAPILTLTTKTEAAWQTKLETAAVHAEQLAYHTTLLLTLMNHLLRDCCTFLNSLFLQRRGDFDLLSRVVSQLAQGIIEAEHNEFISHFTLVLNAQGQASISQNDWQEITRVFYGISSLHTLASASDVERKSLTLNSDRIDIETSLTILSLAQPDLRFPWAKLMATSLEPDFEQLVRLVKKLKTTESTAILTLLSDHQKLANLNLNTDDWIHFILFLKLAAQPSVMSTLKNLTPSIEITPANLAHFLSLFSDTIRRFEIYEDMTVVLDTVLNNPQDLHEFLENAQQEINIELFSLLHRALLQKIIGSLDDCITFMQLHSPLQPYVISRLDSILIQPFTINNLADYILKLDLDQQIPTLKIVLPLLEKVINSAADLRHFIQCFSDERQVEISTPLIHFFAKHIRTFNHLQYFLNDFTQQQTMQLAPLLETLCESLQREPYDLLIFFTLLDDTVRPIYLNAWQRNLPNLITTGSELATMLCMIDRNHRLNLLLTVQDRLATLIDSEIEPNQLLQRIYSTLKTRLRLPPLETPVIGGNPLISVEKSILADMQTCCLEAGDHSPTPLTATQSGLIQAFIEARVASPKNHYPQPHLMAKDLLILALKLHSAGFVFAQTEPFTRCFVRSMEKLKTCRNGFDTTSSPTPACCAQALSSQSSGYGPGTMVVYEHHPFSTEKKTIAPIRSKKVPGL